MPLNPQHHAPEASSVLDSVVDRVAGSVLSQTYKCGGSSVTEWVVVSQRAKSCRVSTSEGDMLQDSDAIRVMAWVELKDTSKRGATDWRILQRVMLDIARAEGGVPGLSLRRLVLYVNAQGVCSCPNEMMASVQVDTFVRFKFPNGSEEPVDVEQANVLPQKNIETRLAQPARGREMRRGAAQGAKDCIEAFFVQNKSDKRIDVQRESQAMKRIIMNSACGWECSTNSQPTLQDLNDSLESATQRNVKVLHLAGHSRRDCGFVWNADDAATDTMEEEICTLAGMIAKAAGLQGSIECAVLNACSTKELGERLKEAGMPHILCWKTPVQDETARELCRRFYDALMQQSKDRSQPSRDYRRAFRSAVDVMREHSFTGGAARLPGASTALQEKKTCIKARDDGGNDGAASAILKDGVHFRNAEPDVDAAPSLVREVEGTRTTKMPWELEDVIQFLSKDGDSELVYLWRKCEPLRQEPSVPGGRPMDSPQVFLVFCAQYRDDKNDMHGEGQKIVRIICELPGCTFRPLYYSRPTLQDLQGALRRATTDKVVGLHFIGHGESEGLFVVSEDGKRPARVEADRLKDMLRSAPSIQVCLLNACVTENLGRQLRDGGVKNVVCWRGNVADCVAERFSQEFYKTLNETPGDFRKAFMQGKLASAMLQDDKYFDGERRPAGIACYLSFDSVARDILPNEDVSVSGFESPGCLEEVEDHESDEALGAARPVKEETEITQEIAVAQAHDSGSVFEEERSLNNGKGAAELAALKELDFKLDYNGYSIEAGIRLHGKGQLLTAAQVRKYGLREKVIHNGHKLLYLSDPAARAVLGVASYTDRSLWIKNGAIHRRAQRLEVFKVEKAIKYFLESLQKRPAGGDSGHNFMRRLLQDCVVELESCVSTRHSEIALADRRCKQALEEEQVSPTCGSL